MYGAKLFKKIRSRADGYVLKKSIVGSTTADEIRWFGHLVRRNVKKILKKALKF